jgi:uncharacterized cupredoxin-like copper-binding protein
MKRYAVLAIAAIVTLVMAACSSSSSSSGASGSSSESAGGSGDSLNASVKDFAIALDQSSVTSGEVTFDIANEGPSTHEFVVVQSDLAPDALPVSDNEVQEDDLNSIGEQEDIAPSTTTTLSLHLDPGSYVVFCNLTSHYEQGMYAGLTVT